MLPSGSLFWDGGAKVPTKDWTHVVVGYRRARLALDGDVLSLTIHRILLRPLSKRRAQEATFQLTPTEGAIIYPATRWSPVYRGLGIGRLGHRPAFFWPWRGRDDILRAVEAAGFTVSWTEQKSGSIRDSECMTRPPDGQNR